MKKSELKYIGSRIKDKIKVVVEAILADDCKNGHHDFSLTCSGYHKEGRKWEESFAGCCHDEILKVFPELKIMERLHLSDYLGVPMFAMENGYYFATRRSQGKSIIVAEHFRCTLEEAESLINAGDKLYFQYLVEHVLKLPERWKKEADEGIRLLEELTGDTWEKPDTCVSTYTPLTDNEVDLIKERLEEGYYTPEAIIHRKEKESLTKLNKCIDEVKRDYNKEVKKVTQELLIKSELEIAYLRVKYNSKFENIPIGDKPIYYCGSNLVVGNWMSYSSDKWTEESFDIFVDEALESKIIREINPKFKINDKD